MMFNCSTSKASGAALQPLPHKYSGDILIPAEREDH